MAYVYGDASLRGDVGMLISLEAVGPVAVTTARNVLLLVGRSARGPTDLVGMTQSLSAKAYYYGGDLKEAIEDAFGEGVPRIYAKRVLGADNAKASVVMTDGLESPSNVLTAYAKSPGAWGNALSIDVSLGSILHAYEEYFNGNGLGGLYALQQCGYKNPQPAAAFVKVRGETKTIVYEEDDLGVGKVWLDCDNGTLKFYTSELPTAADQIHVSLYRYGINLRITDNETIEWRNDIKDLDDLVAALGTSTLVNGVAADGQTHLPKAGTSSAPETYILEGGDDGDEITAEDWEQALREAGNDLKKVNIVPTAVALTDHEVQAGSNDLIAIASAWAMDENTQFRPTIVFMPTKPGETPEKMVELSQLYSNRHLAIVYPSWDESERRKNLAVCCAAREAALPLGESAAADDNRLKGANGLHGDLNDTINQDYVVALNRRGIYVLEKTDAGVGPHMGVTTDKTDQFKRTVDQRTANWIIVSARNVLKKFFHKRNTTEVREWMKQSLDGFLIDEKNISQSIYDFMTAIWPDSEDPNFVHVAMKFIPIGHIEWIEVQMRMGVYTDLQALQGS